MKADQNFSYNLVKGRIAETVFQQLLRDAGCFTILAFGYENILPELARRQGDIHARETMEIIRRAPDFVVINNKTHDVHLIEVKYMKSLEKRWVLEDALRMYESWKPSYLFLATPGGFYFDKAKEIIKKRGGISPLEHPQISSSLQTRYLGILNEFISPKIKINDDVNLLA